MWNFSERTPALSRIIGHKNIEETIARAWAEVSQGAVDVCTCKRMCSLYLFHGHVLRWCCRPDTRTCIILRFQNRFFVASYICVVSLNAYSNFPVFCSILKLTPGCRSSTSPVCRTVAIYTPWFWLWIPNSTANWSDNECHGATSEPTIHALSLLHQGVLRDDKLIAVHAGCRGRN
jgi:hypothetical protein